VGGEQAGGEYHPSGGYMAGWAREEVCVSGDQVSNDKGMEESIGKAAEGHQLQVLIESFRDVMTEYNV
jgi:hypothetical protein